MQEVQEQPDQSPEIQNRLNDLKARWSDVYNKVVDQQQTIEDVVPAAITCEEAWEELEPHLNDVEARLKKITTIPVEHKGLTKQQNILKVIMCWEFIRFISSQLNNCKRFRLNLLCPSAKPLSLIGPL